MMMKSNIPAMRVPNAFLKLIISKAEPAVTCVSGGVDLLSGTVAKPEKTAIAKPMMRKCVPLLTLGAALLVAVAACSDASKPAPGPADVVTSTINNPPNVVLIIANDLGVDDISAYANGRIKTPNLERLAAAGVMFTSAYSASSVSGPARAGLLTGTHPSRFGYEYDNAPGPREEKERLGLPLAEMTLGSALLEQKYATGYIGLWGLGGASVYYPTNRGFSEFYGVLSDRTAYAPMASPDMITVPSPAFAEPPVLDKYSRIYTGPESDSVDQTAKYLTTDFADRAADFIDRRGDEPFFLTLAFNGPHGPLQTPKADYERFASLTNPNARAYAAMVTSLDTAVGQVLDALDRKKLAGNTLVVFTSDSGCDVESAACTCNGLRGGATTLYEGGTRVPFIMRWPEKITAKTQYARPVSTLDIFATVLTATDTPRPAGKKLDGVDLMPYLSGKKNTEPHPTLVWVRRPAMAMRYQDWKFITSPMENKTQLFDLTKDPREIKDLSASRPEMLQKMMTQLELERTFVNDPLWRSRGTAELDFCQQSAKVYR
jgi:arylsulfatase A-like enzyme